jgi:hypothetical protein
MVTRTNKDKDELYNLKLLRWDPHLILHRCLHQHWHWQAAILHRKAPHSGARVELYCSCLAMLVSLRQRGCHVN